jgi:hypothetical protein
MSGGKRKGAGRPKSATTKKTITFRDASLIWLDTKVRGGAQSAGEILSDLIDEHLRPKIYKDFDARRTKEAVRMQKALRRLKEYPKFP